MRQLQCDGSGRVYVSKTASYLCTLHPLLAGVYPGEEPGLTSLTGLGHCVVVQLGNCRHKVKCC